MSAAVRKLSIVCPVYEEEAVLPRFHAELAAVLAGLRDEYEAEIIFVDDGSQDGTLDVLRRLAAADVHVRFLSLSRNFGGQAALTAGLEHASGDVVVTMDSDLQHPPAVIPRLLEQWKEGSDIVLTLRDNVYHVSRVKRLLTACFYRVMRRLCDTDVRAETSDFRLMSRKAVDAFLRLRESQRFMRGMVNWLGFPTTTITFHTGDRAAGVSKYTLRKSLALASDALLSFSRLPLRLSLAAGAAAASAGLLVGGWGALDMLLVSGPVDWGWYVLMATVLAVGGCILLALGIVGEYVGRIYEQVKDRPIYLLKDASPELVAKSDRQQPRRAA